MNDLQRLRCPLCGDDKTSFLTNRLRFERTAGVWQCETCSLVFLDQSSFVLPEDFYERQYHQTYLSHIDPAFLDCRAYYQKMLQTTQTWSTKFKRCLTGFETVLDFGCSTGHFMRQISAGCAKVYGYELNGKEVEFCRNELQLDVSGEKLERRFSNGMFDYITMIFVLEHLAEPLKVLEELQYFLKPGGSFVIVVPNFYDALVHLYDIPRFYEFYFCIEHLFYYSPKSMRRLCAELNWEAEIEVVQEYPITNHLNWIYRQKPADLLASRRPVPDVPLRDRAVLADWENLWAEIDDKYRTFLLASGMGDRLWCQIHPKISP